MNRPRREGGRLARRIGRVRAGVVAGLAATVLLAGVAGAQPPIAAAEVAREAPRLADLIALIPGTTIAEIGAGRGEMTVAMAKLTGPTGRVYATELNSGRLADIRAAVSRAGLKNVTVVQAGEEATNLPDSCCQAIYMREVYHHLTDPTAIDASLFRALRPGGLLAIIDFPPGGGAAAVPPGVPKDRGGHGIPSNVLVHELTAVGFQVAREIPDWGDGLYAMLFQKPTPR